MADLHSKILDAPPPLGSNIFISMQFSANVGQIICWRPPLSDWTTRLQVRRSLLQFLQNIGPDASNFVSCSECRTKNLCFSKWILESIWSILLYEINYEDECLNNHLQHHKLNFCHAKYISSNVGSRISQTVGGGGWVGWRQPQGWGKTYYLARFLPKTA